MVELRKRKTPPPAPVRPTKKKAAPKADKADKADKPVEGKVVQAKASIAETVEAVKEAVTGKPNGDKTAAHAAPGGHPTAGDLIDLANFGGEVATHEGTQTTLVQLVEESKSGVVLFTYPKASTPGCTKQACIFRDEYAPLTATGFAIYGLSSDTPKSNTSFKTKQNLPYPLLCDPQRTLIAAIGLKSGKGTTTRGVFVVDKAGKVLAAEAGSPDGTVEVVRKLVAAAGGGSGAGDETAKEQEDAEVAKTAGEVADTAAEIDSEKA